MKKTTSNHLITKLPKTSCKEGNLKSNQKKKKKRHIIYTEKEIRMKVDFVMNTMQGRGQMELEKKISAYKPLFHENIF